MQLRSRLRLPPRRLCDFDLTSGREPGPIAKHRVAIDESFDCDLCGVRCRSVDAFVLHLREKHKRHLECLICGKSFKTRNGVYHHLLSHTRTPTVQCVACDRKFHLYNQMHYHMRTTHPSAPKRSIEETTAIDTTSVSEDELMERILHADNECLAHFEPEPCAIRVDNINVFFRRIVAIERLTHVRAIQHAHVGSHSDAIPNPLASDERRASDEVVDFDTVSDHSVESMWSLDVAHANIEHEICGFGMFATP